MLCQVAISMQIRPLISHNESDVKGMQRSPSGAMSQREEKQGGGATGLYMMSMSS